MLPDALMAAWPPDTFQKIGCIAQMVDVDLELSMLPRSIIDHPWLNLDVTFPFSEIGTGKVVCCLTHPKGYLMFDVVFPEPVPPINCWPGGCEIILKDNPTYHKTQHRFSASELLSICKGHWTPYHTIDGIRVSL